MSQVWRIRLSRRAETDLDEIARWTVQRFGVAQAERYAETMISAIEASQDGPDVVGARARDDIGLSMHTLHVGRHGRPGRHFVVFRVAADEQTIEILRLLHDSMDPARHVAVTRRKAAKK